MNESIVLYKENQLKLNIEINQVASSDSFVSRKYLCGVLYFQVRVLCNPRSPYCTRKIDIKFEKMLLNDDLNYKCLFTSAKLNKQNECFTEAATWYNVFYQPDGSSTFSFDLTVQFKLETVPNLLASLYEDTELNDLELYAEDGSVSFHSALLAGVSPYFMSMLTGPWKETKEGKVKVADTTKETLKHFKDYIYLDKLPETGIQELLLLASYYMMPELVKKCNAQLLFMLTPENALDLIEFSIKFKMTNLLLGILSNIRDGGINVDGLPGDDWINTCQTTKTIIEK